MKALTFQKGVLGLSVIQLPPLKYGWVRLRLHSAGLCGTDVAKYSSCSLPKHHTYILGHEFVGTIEEISGNASKLKVGDIVAVMPLLPCKNCLNCHAGNENLCIDGRAIGRTEMGAFAEKVDVPVENLVKIARSFPDVYILLDPLAVCLHANSFVSRNLTPKKCLVIGDGTIACLQAWFQQQLGDDVWMLAKHKLHLEFMQQFGIKAYQPLQDNGQFDVIFEAVGRSQADTLAVAAEKVAPRGQIIVLGVYEPGYLLPLEVRKIFIKEVTVVGTNAYNPDEFTKAGLIVESNGGELKKFITHWLPLSQLDSAVKLAQHKDGLVLKIGLINDLSSETKRSTA